MQKSEELYGKIPTFLIKLRHKVAVSMISYAQRQLTKNINKPFEKRDFSLENRIVKAIKFWEFIRDEAKEELLSKDTKKQLKCAKIQQENESELKQ